MWFRMLCFVFQRQVPSFDRASSILEATQQKSFGFDWMNIEEFVEKFTGNISKDQSKRAAWNYTLLSVTWELTGQHPK